MTRTLEQLERDLRQGGAAAGLEPDRLAEIRRRGGRRRWGRRTAAGAGALVAVVTVGGLTVGGQGDVARDQPPASQQEQPQAMSDLTKRALRQIPGATKVSSWQVVIPGPGRPASMELEITADHIVGTPSDTGARVYLGPTMFAKGTFPDWLYDGVEHIEQTDLASDDGGHPVGSLEPGILVDYAAAELACVTPYWDGADAQGPCSPTLLSRVGDKWYPRWGMGTDDFLEPGSDMEVFQAPDFSTGRPTHLAIAGLDGTDIARADFVSSDGTVTEGTVLAGTLVEGDTMMFANVPGELASVIAYDAEGEVVENHPLKDCDDPVSCEVR
jgi:hypothetical protein